jgi:hypothetical protein
MTAEQIDTFFQRSLVPEVIGRRSYPQGFSAGVSMMTVCVTAGGERPKTCRMTSCLSRARVEYSIVPDGMRYCEVFARDGTRLFDSRNVIPCDPPPARELAVAPEPDDGYGRRPHPRRFRDQRKQ